MYIKCIYTCKYHTYGIPSAFLFSNSKMFINFTGNAVLGKIDLKLSAIIISWIFSANLNFESYTTQK